MTRFIGIDYGTKRIGIAVGDDVAKLAMPVTTVEARGKLSSIIAAVIKVAAEFDPDEFIVGLPINMDCTEGPQAKLTRTFGDKLSKIAKRPVRYVDERLTSKAARALLSPAELTRKKLKARIDRVAAQVMLQGFLDGAPTQDDPAD